MATTARKSKKTAPALMPRVTPDQFVDLGWVTSPEAMYRDPSWLDTEARQMSQRLRAYLMASHPTGPESILIRDARLILIALGYE